MYKIEFAPLQGYTDAIYRTMHNKVFGGINCYYSPFIRLEKGEVRQKDIKDIFPENNEDINLVPQIIVNSNEEFLKLTESVCNLGYNRIDINMGCPFPLQTKKGRGAAILQNTKHLEDIVESINSINDIDFSIKMRLGMDSAEDAKGALEIINKAKLHHLTIHPRIAKQQYKGEIDYQTFDYIYQNCLHPIIYNGDILSQEDIYNIINIYPKIEGIMIGRGAQGNPWIFRRINHYLATGEMLDKPNPIEIKQMIIKHARLQYEIKGEYTGVREMRKHIAWYTQGLKNSAALRNDVNKIETMDELIRFINENPCLTM